MKKHNIIDLLKIYSEGESCDDEVFAEMRTNILMRTGKHWNKVAQGLSRNLSQMNVERSKRLRLVKNHIEKAMDDRKDIISSMLGDTLVQPKNENEPKDQKVAELAQKVLKHAHEINDWEDFKEKSLDNFEDLGEACCEIYWHPLKGGIKGFHQMVQDVEGRKVPVFKDRFGKPSLTPIDEMGQPHQTMPDPSRPQFSGAVVVERIPPMDLIRPKTARSIKSAPHLTTRRMQPKSELIALIQSNGRLSDEEKAEKIESIGEGAKSAYRVFDAGMGTFEEAPGQVLVLKTYFRSCPQYPRGYFYIYTHGGILFEDELPLGEFGDVSFPIKHKGNIEYEGSCRGFSPMKKARPAQLEINRCASSISETQVAVGWDKLMMSGGAKASRGADFPGMRSFVINGEYQVIPGRSGEQFTGYLESNIAELYNLLQVPENNSGAAQISDPKAELMKNQKQKKRFTRAQSKLEAYFKSVDETLLFLNQKYLSLETLTQIVGAYDAVDLAEFKNANALTFQIKVEPVSGDLDTMMGKMIELETILQYAGKDLDQTTLMSLLSQFPHLNKDGAFEHLTQELDSIRSDILALDRGEYPIVDKSADHEMAVKFLRARKRKKDFKTLSDKVKNAYEQRIGEHEAILAEQMEKIRSAQAGMIPTSGSLVKIDLYINDPANPNKVVKATAPTDSLQWLLQKLAEQGMAQERLEQMHSLESASSIASMMQQPQQPGQMTDAPPTQSMPMLSNGGY